MICYNPQNTRNHDTIEMINPQIFKIVLKLYQLIPQFHFTIKNIKNRGPFLLISNEKNRIIFVEKHKKKIQTLYTASLHVITF